MAADGAIATDAHAYNFDHPQHMCRSFNAAHGRGDELAADACKFVQMPGSQRVHACIMLVM